ncbi:MAG TPA: S8/S53 family peptidase [Geminicoccaceae bacterium]|nr:S8/S53 family peptidase [Geminicoccaceae bacterium]
MAALLPDWNLTLVQAPEARAMLPRRNGQVDWGGVRVAHLDTGFTEHPGFGYRPGETPWLLPELGLNVLAPGVPRDPLDYEGNPGHGTRTCSILCGDAVRMPGEGEIGSPVGVAPRLPVVPCRVVTSVVLHGEERRLAVARGIRHAIAQGCDAVSISLGIPSFPIWALGEMGQAVDEAYEAGLIVVAAGGQIVDSVCYPAKFNRTIGVGGITAARRIWFDYDAGKDEIDVWAPASEVLRLDSLAPAGAVTLPPSQGEDPGGSSLSSGSHGGFAGKGAGTSYATVHVAAAAAMWPLARGRDLDAAYGERWQRIEAFRRLLRETAGPLAGPQPSNGTGILRIAALLRADLPHPDLLRRSTEDRRKRH